MIGRILLCGFLSSVWSLKLSQRYNSSIASEVSESCANTEKEAERFLEKQGNGRVVGRWREINPSWSYMVKSDAGSMCMVRGDKLDQEKPGQQVVLDFAPQNELSCCKTNTRTSHSFTEFTDRLTENQINLTRFDYYIQKGIDHPAKRYAYEVVMPEACQPGGKKAPCPMFVSLHGKAHDHLPHMALECDDCIHDMGVVVLMPYLQCLGRCNEEERVQGDFIWDSALWLGEEFVRTVTQEVLQAYSKSIDPEHVYLFGLSMGGAGAIMDAITEPDIFRAAFAVSPTSTIRESENFPVRAAAEWKPLYSERKDSRRLKAIYIYQGGLDMDGDDINWNMLPQTLFAKGADLEQEPLHTEFHVFPGLEHDCWVAAFELSYDLLWKGKVS